MSSFDACDTVSTRCARVAADRIIHARVEVAGAVRQVLREPQVDAVVNRDDGRAAGERRDDVVRRVEQSARARRSAQGIVNCSRTE